MYLTFFKNYTGKAHTGDNWIKKQKAEPREGTF